MGDQGVEDENFGFNDGCSFLRHVATLHLTFPVSAWNLSVSLPRVPNNLKPKPSTLNPNQDEKDRRLQTALWVNDSSGTTWLQCGVPSLGSGFRGRGSRVGMFLGQEYVLRHNQTARRALDPQHHMVASQTRRTPIWMPKNYSPYYGDLSTWNP